MRGYLIFHPLNPVHTRLLSPFTVESCPEHLVREFGFLGGKRFYSVVAQENPHLNDSELREVESDSSA